MQNFPWHQLAGEVIIAVIFVFYLMQRDKTLAAELREHARASHHLARAVDRLALRVKRHLAADGDDSDSDSDLE